MAEPRRRPMSEPEPDPYRLPRAVVPSRYEIRLEPDLGAATFTGVETVTVTVEEPVSAIVLNAAELEIQEIVARDEQGTTLRGKATPDPAAERARLAFSEPLAPGTWRLTLRFTGTLGSRLHGFYRSAYRDATGAERFLAATQFEATDARRAFPCWDEPAFKAAFEVKLVVDEGLTALSNTAAVGERPLPGTGKKEVAFAPTIKMSTYLVAFAVGDFEATEPVMVEGTPIRVWCVRGKRHLAGSAREAAAFSLRFFQDYYGLPYPGDKLDLIALPDFAAGAMENLGLITFRETALLVDAEAASHAELERVADVVAHEIAHMWFGDLVTMAWWNGLWLNEAFATFMEMLAVDAFRPAWERWVTFGVSRASALHVDGLWSSRPIEFPVAAPRDADAMFDVLTYEKGAAVLRMLEQYLGPEVFRAGVRRYLVEHRYANAETTDLWKALGEATTDPVPAIMDGWIFRPGYPVVTVGPDPAGAGLILAQRRFTYLPDGAREPELWHVPVTLRVSLSGQVRRIRLLLGSAEERVALEGTPDWVVVNEGGHGFYRVRYAPDLLAGLTGRLYEALSAIERFGLVNDAWAAALAGLMPAAEYLELTAHFRGETDRNVWAALVGSFGSLYRVIAPAERPGLEVLVRDRLGPAAARLGWEPQPGEGELTRQLRGDLLRALGTLGNDATIQAEARERYARYLADRSAVDPNVVPALVAILAHAGGEAEYAEFLDRFKTATTPQEEQRYLYALAGFRQPGLIEKTLERTISGEVRVQDGPFLLRGLLASVHSRELAWGFVKERWETLERRFPPKSGLRRMCEGITALATPELEADVRAFFGSRGITLGGKTLEQYLEQLHVAVAFGEREAAALRVYLARGVEDA